MDFLPSLDHAFWIVALGSMATIPAGTCLPTTVDPTRLPPVLVDPYLR
jgi:hypothetical protein